MTIKLDKVKVPHSIAGNENDRIWFYEELGKITLFETPRLFRAKGDV